MEKTNRYDIEGVVLDIPLRLDEYSQKHLDDYSDFIEHPVCTPEGRPILLTIEDACPYAEMVDDDSTSIDCGSCIHFRQPTGSLLGVCHNEKMRSSSANQMDPESKEKTR